VFRDVTKFPKECEGLCVDRHQLPGCWQLQSQSLIATDGQSVSMSWCRAQSGTFDQRFLFFSKLLSCLFRGALSDERPGLSCVSLCH
jgi:hypothetical protein